MTLEDGARDATSAWPSASTSRCFDGCSRVARRSSAPSSRPGTDEDRSLVERLSDILASDEPVTRAARRCVSRCPRRR